MPLQKVTTYGFTTKSEGIVRVLSSPVKIAQAFDPQTGQPQPLKEYKGIWDTGATNSAISDKVVMECGLKPIGVTKVFHADGETLSDVFLISLVLPNNVGIPSLRVTKGKIKDADVLIGMDVMTAGDFALSNFQGKTTFCFRIPSVECIDFDPRQKTPATNPLRKVGRNDPCPCGSGKKYKKCHGR